ncbi:hypothetical protein LAZ67_19000419, partial [Cordylochernes scorpioides]
MAFSEPKSAHLREVLLFAFNWKKIATEAHRMLEEVYGDNALSKSQCYRWFKKFQSGDIELVNEPRGKLPQKFENAELQALLDEDSTQTQEKLAKQLQVSQGAVSLRLNSLGMTQKLSGWVPHELSERQQERRLEVYGDNALSKSQCYRWFKKFQSGDFELDNEPRGKPPQKFENAELQALLDEDSTQTQEKLAKQLQVSQGAVSLRLNSLGMTQKLSGWVPHELSERLQERRL